MTIHSFDFWQDDYKYFLKSITFRDKSKYCPECLKENKYHKIYWQLSPISLCLKHKIFLSDKCKKCGQDITVDNVVKGQCICGNILSEDDGMHCNEDSIIEVQKKLYKSFGIEAELLNDYSFDLLGYRNSQMIVIIVFLRYIIESKYEVFKEIGLFENNNLDIYQNCFKTVEKILSDYPNEFIRFLDMINDNIMKFINKSNKNSLYYKLYNLTNPLYCLRLIENEQLLMGLDSLMEHLNFFNSVLFNYYKDKYNNKFFEKRIEKLKDTFESIYFYDGFEYLNFNIDINTICYLQNNHVEDRKYITNNISNYIKYFVRNSELFIEKRKLTADTERYISISELVKIYEPFEIKMLEVLSEIKRKKITVYISLFADGLESLYVPEIVAKRFLLKLALKRLD